MLSGVGWGRIAEAMLPDQVDDRAWYAVDGLCSLSCSKGTSGSSCALQVAVTTCSCRVVGLACFVLVLDVSVASGGGMAALWG